jgi:hypothetical protein
MVKEILFFNFSIIIVDLNFLSNKKDEQINI